MHIHRNVNIALCNVLRCLSFKSVHVYNTKKAHFLTAALKHIYKKVKQNLDFVSL